MRSATPAPMLPNEFDVAGKVVLITGAGRGIGSGIAEVLAEAGATVALNALTPTFADATAQAIREGVKRQAGDSAAGAPGTVEAFSGDVTQTAGADDIVQRVLERFGRIDVLVNNLGDAIMKPLVALPETQYAHHRRRGAAAHPRSQRDGDLALHARGGARTSSLGDRAR